MSAHFHTGRTEAELPFTTINYASQSEQAGDFSRDDHTVTVLVAPAAMDLVRLLVLNAGAAAHVAANDGALRKALAAAAAPPPLTPNLLTALRLLTNCATHACLHPWLLSMRAEVSRVPASCLPPLLGGRSIACVGET